MSGSPLPPLAPHVVHDRASIVNAYDMILRLEKTMLTAIDLAESNHAREEAERSLMYCRIVGHFFHHVPTDTGLSYIVREVILAEEDKQKLLDLGKFYFDHALRVLRYPRVYTARQFFCPWYSPSNSQEDLIEGDVRDASQRDDAETAKNQALIRDGFRCVVSGMYDLDSYRQQTLPESIRQQLEPAVTQCWHIFPESTNLDVGDSNDAVYDTTTCWAVLSHLSGHKDLLSELNGPNVRRLENIMTMELQVHMLFSCLDLWLEPTEVDNQYLVKGSDLRFRHKGKVITFTSTSPEFPLPSRDYLALHAACAKVAHLSAAIDYLDKMFEDMETRLYDIYLGK